MRQISNQVSSIKVKNCSITSLEAPNRFCSSEHTDAAEELPNLLDTQVLRRPRNVVIGKSGHEVVAMVVVGLHAELNVLVVASFLGCLNKVLGKELALLVEVISGALARSVVSWSDIGGTLTTSISISNGPFHCFTSSVASCSFHFCCWSSPKYPLNAFWPHGQLIGFAIGANAETDLYMPGFLRN